VAFLFGPSISFFVVYSSFFLDELDKKIMTAIKKYLPTNMFGDDVSVAYPLLSPYKQLTATSPSVAQWLSCSFVGRPFYFCGHFFFFLDELIFSQF